MNLESTFVSRIKNTFGDDGKQWLSDLPQIIDYCSNRYQLTDIVPFERLSYNFTATATDKSSTEIVIKIGVPTENFNHELVALREVNGKGMAHVIDHDSSKGIILLEKLSPGHTLATLSDDVEATKIAIELMKELWRPVPEHHSFPTTQDWYEKIEVIETVNHQLIERALKQCQELHQSMGEPMLLHGDLHHFNILSAEREPWLAIDPKGVVSEREFEVGAILRNPIPNIATTMDTKKVLLNRIDLMVDLLEFDRQKIIAWGFVQTVFAALWCERVGDDMWEPLQVCAEVLSVLP